MTRRAHSMQHFLLGLEGLALLRLWLTGSEDAVAARIAEIEQLVGSPDEDLLPGVHAPEHDPMTGYAAWSETYDQPGNPLIAIEEPVVHGLLPEGDGVALDAACGTGRHLARLAERGWQTVGVDQSPAMLERAHARVPDARLHEASLLELPFDDATIDLAVCSLALTHLPELEPGIAELARVVRPGGTLVLSDIHPGVVLLGGQGFFRDAEDRPGYVRNHLHLHGSYLAAFRNCGLSVRACLEPPYHGDAIWKFRMADRFPDVLHAALEGFPAALVWDLERAHEGTEP